MNIVECYSLHDIVKELELALQIEDNDLREPDIDKLLDNIKLKINRQYNVDLSEYKINSTELELSQQRESAVIFIDNIAAIHAKLCGYCQIRRFLTTSDISLDNVNYLGFVPNHLTKTLKAIQRATLKPKAEEGIKAIKGKLASISNSWEKRLFVLLVVCNELGFPEVTASIAEVLFQSTISM